MLGVPPIPRGNTKKEIWTEHWEVEAHRRYPGKAWAVVSKRRPLTTSPSFAITKTGHANGDHKKDVRGDEDMMRHIGFSMVIAIFLISTASCGKKEEVVVPKEEGKIVGKVSIPGEKDLSGVTVSIDALGVSTETDRNGNFVISGVMEGAWELRFTKEGYSEKRVMVAVGPGQTVDAGVIELEKPSRAYGVISLEGGGSPKGAKVMVEGEGVKEERIVGEDGAFSFTLPSGSYRIKAYLEGYEEKSTSVDLGPGEELEVSLTLPKIKMIFFDDFSKPGFETRWDIVLSTWFVGDGILVHNSGGNNKGDVLVKGLTFKDGIIELKCLHTYGDTDWGIIFRGTSIDSCYCFLFENGSLWIRNGGTNGGTIKSTPYNPSVGEWYKMRVEAKGSSIKCYVNDQLIFEIDDSTFSEGVVGIHSWYDAKFDDFVIWPIK
jgi:hypothetical protein